MNRKRIIPVVAVVVVAVALYFILRARNGGGPLDASGTVEATDAQLGFQAAGRIDTLLVDEGDRVKAGQLLARLDQSELMTRAAQEFVKPLTFAALSGEKVITGRTAAGLFCSPIRTRSP